MAIAGTKKRGNADALPPIIIVIEFLITQRAK